MLHFFEQLDHGMETALSVAVPLISGIAELIGLLIIVISLLRTAGGHLRLPRADEHPAAGRDALGAGRTGRGQARRTPRHPPRRAQSPRRLRLALAGRRPPVRRRGRGGRKPRRRALILAFCQKTAPAFCRSWRPRQKRRPGLDIFHGASYTSFVESKGADGHKSVGAFLLSAPRPACSGRIEGSPSGARGRTCVKRAGFLLLFLSFYQMHTKCSAASAFCLGRGLRCAFLRMRSAVSGRGRSMRPAAPGKN